VATPGPAADLGVVLFDAASGAWLAAGSNWTLLRSVDGGVVGRSTDGGATWRIAPVEMPQPLTPVTGFPSCGSPVSDTGITQRGARISPVLGRMQSAYSDAIAANRGSVPR
jgi:hypothetical protein